MLTWRRQWWLTSTPRWKCREYRMTGDASPMSTSRQYVICGLLCEILRWVDVMWSDECVLNPLRSWTLSCRCVTTGLCQLKSNLAQPKVCSRKDLWTRLRPRSCTPGGRLSANSVRSQGNANYLVAQSIDNNTNDVLVVMFIQIWNSTQSYSQVTDMFGPGNGRVRNAFALEAYQVWKHFF